MDENGIPEIDKPKRFTSCVLFSKEEYQEIKRSSLESGRSIPNLLKHAFFDGRTAKVLFPPDERHKVINQLIRIGGNVNQIARKMNSGIREGWYPEFQEAIRVLRSIQERVVSVYGIR